MDATPKSITKHHSFNQTMKRVLRPVRNTRKNPSIVLSEYEE